MTRSLFSLFIVILLCGGCARPELRADLPKIDSFKAPVSVGEISTATTHYRVHTESSEQTTQDIGTLMEATYRSCTELLGSSHQQPALSVYAFVNQERYRQHLQQHGMEGMGITGFYTPKDPAGIYLPLVEANRTHPFFTLVHEGLHQYLHEVKGYPVPGSDIRLPVTPPWLSEGLALFMEAALVNIHELSPGRIHPPRLKHLQQALKRKDAPDLAALFAKSYGEPFSNEDYSVSWGIIHYLYQNDEWQPFRDFWLRSIAMEAERFLAMTRLDNQGRYLDLQTEWAEILGRRSLQVARDFLGGPQGLANWQKHWQNSILLLTSKQ